MRYTKCSSTMTSTIIDNGLIYDRIIIIINVPIRMLSSTFTQTHLLPYCWSMMLTLLVSISIVQVHLIFTHFNEGLFLIRYPLFHLSTHYISSSG